MKGGVLDPSSALIERLADAVKAEGGVAAISSEWAFACLLLTTNPKGSSGALLTEQHGARFAGIAGDQDSSNGQHDIEPMACISCIDIEHCMTWSPCTSANPASAHTAINRISSALASFRNVVFAFIFSLGAPSFPFFWERVGTTISILRHRISPVCDAGHFDYLIRRAFTQNVSGLCIKLVSPRNSKP